MMENPAPRAVALTPGLSVWENEGGSVERQPQEPMSVTEKQMISGAPRGVPEHGEFGRRTLSPRWRKLDLGRRSAGNDAS